MLVKLMTEHIINQKQTDNKGSEKHKISLRLALVRQPFILIIKILPHKRINFIFHLLALRRGVLFLSSCIQ